MGGAGLGNAQQHGRDFMASQVGFSLSISFPPAQRVKWAVRLTFLTTATRTPALFPFSLHRTAAVFLGQRKFDFFVHREIIPDGRIQSFASANIDVRQLERNGIID